MRRIAAILPFAIPLAAAAEAQELTAALSAYSPFGINDLDGELPLSAEFRFTMSISDRFALEPFVTVGSHRSRRRAGPEGFFGAQVRQRIVRFTSKNVYAFATLFATYGAAACYSGFGSYPPVIGHFGFGLHQRVSDYLAFRPEAQLVTFHVVPIGARFVAGVSVDVGR
jgi:hypothetical protein